MKTKSIQIGDYVALLTWNKTEKRVFVVWFELSKNTGFSEIEKWPTKECKEFYDNMQKVLSKVRLFCETKNLTLWSY